MGIIDVLERENEYYPDIDIDARSFEATECFDDENILENLNSEVLELLSSIEKIAAEYGITSKQYIFGTHPLRQLA